MNAVGSAESCPWVCLVHIANTVAGSHFSPATCGSPETVVANRTGCVPGAPQPPFSCRLLPWCKSCRDRQLNKTQRSYGSALPPAPLFPPISTLPNFQLIQRTETGSSSSSPAAWPDLNLQKNFCHLSHSADITIGLFHRPLEVGDQEVGPFLLYLCKLRWLPSDLDTVASLKLHDSQYRNSFCFNIHGPKKEVEEIHFCLAQLFPLCCHPQSPSQGLQSLGFSLT